MTLQTYNPSAAVRVKREYRWYQWHSFYARQTCLELDNNACFINLGDTLGVVMHKGYLI